MNRKRLGLVALVILVVLFVLALVVPRVLTRYVEGQIQQRLAHHGVEAKWSSFSGAFGRSFVFEGLSLRDTRRGVVVDADHVQISFSIASLADRTLNVDALEVVGARLEYDLSTDEKREVSSSQNGPDAGLREVLQRAIQDPPEVLIRDSSVVLVRDREQLLRASTTETSLDLGWELAEAVGDVRLEISHRSYPGWLKSIEARFQASLDLRSGKFDSTFKHPEASRPLVAWEHEEFGRLGVQDVAVSGSIPEQAGVVVFHQVVAEMGEATSPALSLESSEIALEYDGRPRVRVQDAGVVFTPAKRAVIENVLKIAGGSDAQANLRPSAFDARMDLVPDGPIVRRLKPVVRLLEKVDFEFSGVQVDVNLMTDEERFTTLTLLEGLTGQATAGHVRAVGRTAGGAFHGEADFLPGEVIPRFAYLNLKGLDLDQIPGMPAGRSQLPSRGTSGRVGGVLSVNLYWQMPLEGHTIAPLYASSRGTVAVDWQNGVVDLVGVSEEPLTGISFSTTSDFSWNPKLNTLSVQQARLDWGPVDVLFDLKATDFPMDTRFSLRAKMSKIDCQRAIRSIPAGMLGPYRNIEMEGEWEPSIDFYLPINRPRELRLEVEGYEDVCFPTALNVPKSMRPEDVEVRSASPTGFHASVVSDGFEGPALADVAWLNRPFVKRVTEGLSSEEIEVFVGPGTNSYVPLEQMPVWVGGSAFLSEEMMFYTDPAVSIGLITKALRLNLEQGRFVYGGSTVTQQLVKNLFLTRDKTLSRKLQEALIAWRITQLVSKDRVLELYLNCIEFGPDIYGIGPAAQYYFQKDARDLSPLEAVFLSMLKPNPLYGARVIQRRKTPEGVWWTNRTKELFQRMLDRGMISPEQMESEKPYILEWDESGRYIDRKKQRFPSLSPSLP